MSTLIVQCQRHVIKNEFCLSLVHVFLLTWMIAREWHYGKGMLCTYWSRIYIAFAPLKKIPLWSLKARKMSVWHWLSVKSGPIVSTFILLSKVGGAKYHTSHLSDIRYSLNPFMSYLMKFRSSHLQFQLFLTYLYLWQLTSSAGNYCDIPMPSVQLSTR